MNRAAMFQRKQEAGALKEVVPHELSFPRQPETRISGALRGGNRDGTHLERVSAPDLDPFPKAPPMEVSLWRPYGQPRANRPSLFHEIGHVLKDVFSHELHEVSVMGERHDAYECPI